VGAYINESFARQLAINKLSRIRVISQNLVADGETCFGELPAHIKIYFSKIAFGRYYHLLAKAVIQSKII